jgi:hypothetical protein
MYSGKYEMLVFYLKFQVFDRVLETGLFPSISSYLAKRGCPKNTKDES